MAMAKSCDRVVSRFVRDGEECLGYACDVCAGAGRRTSQAEKNELLTRHEGWGGGRDQRTLARARGGRARKVRASTDIVCAATPGRVHLRSAVLLLSSPKRGR